MSERRRNDPIDRALRRLRARAVGRRIPAGSRVLDVGCGVDNWLVRSQSGWSDDSLGIDPHLDGEWLDARGRRAVVDDIVAEQPASFDAALSLAVIEHLPHDDVEQHLAMIRSVLRPGGLFLLTTPSPRSKPVLEFLAFRLRLIAAHQIQDHRYYYGGPELNELLRRCGFERVEHRHFQFGLNQRVIARRPAHDDPSGSLT